MDDLDERFESLVLGDFIAPRAKESEQNGGTDTVVRSTERTFEQKVEIVRVETPAERITERIIERVEREKPARKKAEPAERKQVFSVKELISIFRDKIKSLDPKNPNSHNGLVCIGNPGNGKSHTVMDVIKNDFHMVEGEDFKVARGSSTVISIYKVMYDFRGPGKILVLDDIDKVFQDNDGKNLLKAALESAPERKIGYFSSRNFDPRTEEKKREELLAAGKLPNEFTFQGKVIFLSNLEEKDFGSAIIDRCEFMDLYLTGRQVIEMARELKAKLGHDILIDVPDSVKDDVIDFYETIYREDLEGYRHKISLRSIVNGCKTAMLIPGNWKKSILIKERLTDRLHLLG